MSIEKMQKISLRLKEALIEKSIPHQGALADKAGLNRSTVGFIFKRGDGRQVNLSKIQEVLEPISLTWILTGTGEKYTDGREQTKEITSNEIIKAPVQNDDERLLRLIKQAIREEMPNENTHKLMIAYLEEMLFLLRQHTAQHNISGRRAAETGEDGYNQGPPLDHDFPPLGGKK